MPESNIVVCAFRSSATYKHQAFINQHWVVFLMPQDSARRSDQLGNLVVVLKLDSILIAARAFFTKMSVGTSIVRVGRSSILASLKPFRPNLDACKLGSRKF